MNIPKRLLYAARWLALALSANTFALALRAQSPCPDSFNPGANFAVVSLSLQADGKILAGGGFTSLGGQGRNYIGRLNADGTLDSSFNPGANANVWSLTVQPDGKILAGGSFNTLAGQSRGYIGRLEADGTLDTSFDPGADSNVYSLALQPDGKILVGGHFITLGGQRRAYIGRLNADGTLDSSFNPGANFDVFSVVLQADGKILVGGYFTVLGGEGRNYIGRLNADGTVDSSFNPGADSYVQCVALQADGNILVGGAFTTLGAQSRDRIGRIKADGTVDTTFNPGADNFVLSLALQVDGKILAGGWFNTLGGQGRNFIGRLNADGTLDASFNPGASGSYGVYSLSVQADGKILVGGLFTALGGQGRNYLGRLNNTGAATQSLGFDGSTLTWTRGGTSPEVWRTSFEYSADAGASWTNLGDGVRIPGGWQLSGLAVPPNADLRARGYTVGGYENGSGWFVETIVALPGNKPPVPIIAVSPLWQFPDWTNLTVIAPDGINARVVFDGSQSYDPDGTTFNYFWFEGTNLFSTNSAATNTLAVGRYEITLRLDDTFPMGRSSASVTVEVVSPAEAVVIVIGLVEDSDPTIDGKQPLLATLAAAAASFERGENVPGINQLAAFQNKVRAEIAPVDPALGQKLLLSAQRIRDALSGP